MKADNWYLCMGVAVRCERHHTVVHAYGDSRRRGPANLDPMLLLAMERNLSRNLGHFSNAKHGSWGGEENARENGTWDLWSADSPCQGRFFTRLCDEYVHYNWYILQHSLQRICELIIGCGCDASALGDTPLFLARITHILLQHRKTFEHA